MLPSPIFRTNEFRKVLDALSSSEGSPLLLENHANEEIIRFAEAAWHDERLSPESSIFPVLSAVASLQIHQAFLRAWRSRSLSEKAVWQALSVEVLIADLESRRKHLLSFWTAEQIEELEQYLSAVCESPRWRDAKNVFRPEFLGEKGTGGASRAERIERLTTARGYIYSRALLQVRRMQPDFPKSGPAWQSPPVPLSHMFTLNLLPYRFETKIEFPFSCPLCNSNSGKMIITDVGTDGRHSQQQIFASFACPNCDHKSWTEPGRKGVCACEGCREVNIQTERQIRDILLSEQEPALSRYEAWRTHWNQRIHIPDEKEIFRDAMTFTPRVDEELAGILRRSSNVLSGAQLLQSIHMLNADNGYRLSREKDCRLHDEALENKLIYHSKQIPELKTIGELIAYAYVRASFSPLLSTLSPVTYQMILSVSVNAFLESATLPQEPNDEEVRFFGSGLWLATRVTGDEEPEVSGFYFPDVLLTSQEKSPFFWDPPLYFDDGVRGVAGLCIEAERIYSVDEPILNVQLVSRCFTSLDSKSSKHPRLFASDREQEAYETICQWLPNYIVRTRQSSPQLVRREDLDKIQFSAGVLSQTADFVIYSKEGAIAGVAKINPPMPGVELVQVILFD